MIHNWKGQLVTHCSLHPCHKDYKDDWLQRGLLHSFWQQEILVWNLVFINPGGQFGRRHAIPIATRHIIQSKPKVQGGVSFFFQDGVSSACSFPPSLLKCCTHYVSKFGKLSSGHGTGKGQFAFHSQRKAMSKKAQTAAQSHSSHTLAKQCSKFSKSSINSTWTGNFQMFKLDLEKGMEPESKPPTSVGSSEKQESSRKTSASALLMMPNRLTMGIMTNCGKFFKRWEYQATWPASWEICMLVKKQKLKLDMEQQTG